LHALAKQYLDAYFSTLPLGAFTSSLIHQH
jgi:hypothetical protein